MIHSLLRRSLLLIPVLLVNVLVVGCSRQGDAAPQAAGNSAPAPVSVATVMQRDVPVELRAIATVEPYTTVSVRARVSGHLDKVHVTAGQDVNAGDLLFEIDPRPFEATLHEAQARLDRDEALAKNKRVDADRSASLLRDLVATREEADKARFDSEAAEATVRADMATVENTKLQLDYTKIRAPIDGRAGWVMMDRGNVVKADDTALLVLNQLKPILVAFAVPEQDLQRVRTSSNTSLAPSVEVIVPPDAAPSVAGKLSFIDNQVDNATGTIRLKATIENESRLLWPGQFVQAVLKLSIEPNMLVVPRRAVQPGQEGKYVYVLKDDNTVDFRTVIVRREVGDESIIESGVSKDERVVTEGHLRLKPGSKVVIKETAPTTKPQVLNEAVGRAS